METVTLAEARERLESLLERAAAGEEIVIAEPGRPAVRMVPTASPAPKEYGERRLGALRGKVWVADNFDDPLPDDIQAAFEGRGPGL